MDSIKCDVSDDGALVRLSLKRPDQLNALTPDMIAELNEAVRDIARSEARVLVLSGEGRAFSAGVDLKVAGSPSYTPDVATHFAENARALTVMLETMPQVTIARVHGYCFTGGLELVLGCDLIVASQDAIFCDTHAKFGLVARWGLSQRLPRRIGVQRAREMSFTSRRIDAAEAERIGLILKAVPMEELDTFVLGLATQIIANSRDSIAAYKALYRESENSGLDDGIAAEANLRMALRDRATGIASFKKV